MLRSRLFVVACLFCMTPSLASGATFQVDDFQSGTLEGWAGGASPTLAFSGGPSGAGDAFLQLTSTGFGSLGSRLATFNFQPNWIGNVGTLGAGSVSVDLMSPFSSSALDMRLVLFGPTTTSNRWTSTVAASVPNDGIWRTYEFPLAESDLTFVPTIPSAATYDDVMADVIRVMLRHDAGSPTSGGTVIAAMIGIDNVQYVPAPSLTPGDGNGDGWVDGLDYLLWAGHFGENPGPGGGPSNGDYNDDGAVDGLDYLTWAGNFGTHSTSTAVPEPGACATAVLGIAGLLTAARRRRR